MNLAPEELSNALIGFFGTVVSLVASAIGYFIRRALKKLEDRFRNIEVKLESQEQINHDQTRELLSLQTAVRESEKKEDGMRKDVRELRTDIKKMSQTLMNTILPLLKGR